MGYDQYENKIREQKEEIKKLKYYIRLLKKEIKGFKLVIKKYEADEAWRH